MVVVTGAKAYHKFGLETAFGTAIAARGLVFGLEEEISNFSRSEGQEGLQGYDDVTIQEHWYGKTEGSYSVNWKLSSATPFALMFDVARVAVAGQATLSDYTFTKRKDVQSITHEIGVEAGTSHIRTVLGAVCDEISLSGGVGDLISGSASMKYAKEAVIGTVRTPVVRDQVKFPYAFSHGKVELPDGTVIGEVQSMDLTMSQTKELLYGFGSSEATSAYPHMLELTGSLTIPLIDNTQYSAVTARGERADMELVFDAGLSGANQKKITITGTGVGTKSHTLSSVRPNEPVFQQIDFDWREIEIEARQKTITGLA